MLAVGLRMAQTDESVDRRSLHVHSEFFLKGPQSFERAFKGNPYAT